MSSLANDAGILRKPSRGGVPAVGRNSPFAHVAPDGALLRRRGRQRGYREMRGA
jgi:hypothetical protein